MADNLTNRESKKNSFFFILVLVIIILILSFVFGGANGVIGVISFFIKASLIIGFFGFVFYIVYYLFFKKHPRNIPYENWKDYKKSALDNGADMMNELILTGDKKHSAKSFMTIQGYLRVLGFDNKEYDMFVGKRKPMNPFEEHKIVMIEPNNHSDLIGDVYIEGISLIMKYGFYFLNTKMLDWEGIDKGVAQDTFRTIMYETLGDMKGLLDRATGLDSEWSKRQAEQKLLKIPVLSGQQNKPEQPNQ